MTYQTHNTKSLVLNFSGYESLTHLADHIRWKAQDDYNLYWKVSAHSDEWGNGIICFIDVYDDGHVELFKMASPGKAFTVLENIEDIDATVDVIRTVRDDNDLKVIDRTKLWCCVSA